MIPKLTFAAIPKWEGIYTVSTHGHVISEERPIRCQYGLRIKKRTFLKPRTDSKGYHYVTLCDWETGRSQNERIHRLVAKTFIPNPENLPEVNHIDLNTVNNLKSNLEWVTHAGNMEHAKVNGSFTCVTGENNRVAILTEQNVRDMRQERAEFGTPYYMIAVKYGVKTRTAFDAITGRRWKHLV